MKLNLFRHLSAYLAILVLGITLVVAPVSSAKTLYSIMEASECWSGYMVGTLVVNDSTGQVESLSWHCWDPTAIIW